MLRDIQAIVDRQIQSAPKFTTNRLYTRLSAAEVHRQLIAQNGDRDEELPTTATLRTRLNQLGYYPSKVVPQQSRENETSKKRLDRCHF